MKQLLIETQVFKPQNSLLENVQLSDKGNPMVKGILATADKENGNGRYYPRKIWERELDKYQTLIKENRSTGELDHPNETVISLKNVSHIIRKAWWEGNNIMGLIEILPTPSGNILKTLLENDILVGVSSRGLGSLSEEGNRMIVEDDFELEGWDFISTPSNEGSWMHPVKNSQLNEGLIKSYSKYKEVNRIISEILCNNGTCSI